MNVLPAMYPPVPLVQSLLLHGAIASLFVVNVALFFRSIFRRRALWVAFSAYVFVLGAAHVAWSVGPRHFTTSHFGACVASIALPICALIALSVPFAALANRLSTRLLLRPKTTQKPRPQGAPTNETPVSKPEPISRPVTRRALVTGATASVPLSAAAIGLRGFQCSAAAPALRVVELPFVDLPPALDGFSILQLSDLHLGCGRTLHDLDALFCRIADHPKFPRPDLVAFTGDVAEDPALLPTALRMAKEIGARHGVVAALGNHEYLRGIRRARAGYDKSGIELLVNRARELRVGDTSLTVLGVDDPIAIHGEIRGTLARNLDRAIAGSASRGFRLLLSHRPEGIFGASELGVDLTLSGHTHGGQIGFNGRSAFEPLFPDGYLWGAYRRGNARLYTTSGFGHWFPFRVGCNTEAPLVVLRRASASSAATSRVSLR